MKPPVIRFGASVSMSRDVFSFVVGAPMNDNTGNSAGQVRVYQGAQDPTRAPTKVPSKAPTKTPTKLPTKVHVPGPIISPTRAPNLTAPTPSIPVNDKCGLFGWNIFCPRKSKCGWFLRVFNIRECQYLFR